MAFIPRWILFVGSATRIWFLPFWRVFSCTWADDQSPDSLLAPERGDFAEGTVGQASVRRRRKWTRDWPGIT
jgi:hypothetical protein